MKYEIIISGSGGQGIQVLGNILAEAAVKEGKEVSSTIDYGAEVRGGRSEMEIIISDEKIDYPEAVEPNVIILLSEKGISDLKRVLKGGAMVFFDAHIPFKDIEAQTVNYRAVFHSCKSVKIAEDLGNLKIANMAMLGYFVKITGIIKPETVLSLIEEKVKEKFKEINKKAFQEGFNKAVS